MNLRYSCFISRVLGLEVFFSPCTGHFSIFSHTEHHRGVCAKLLTFLSWEAKRGTWKGKDKEKKLLSKSATCDPYPPIRPYFSIPSNFKSIDGLIHSLSEPLWCNHFWKVPRLTNCTPIHEPGRGRWHSGQKKTLCPVLSWMVMGKEVTTSHSLSMCPTTEHLLSCSTDVYISHLVDHVPRSQRCKKTIASQHMVVPTMVVLKE